MLDRVFDTYSHYYDLLYKDKNYFEESEYIKNLLSNNEIINGARGWKDIKSPHHF